MSGEFDRTIARRRLADTHFDVLVIGGGITGAGCALDSASRGLRTALVERDDFASGTSSKSSKLIHGGLRYLQDDPRLVYEALHERQRLRRNAPHLVEVLPFLLPVFRGSGGVISKKLSRALGTALWGYDLTGGIRIGRFHSRISAATAQTHMPTIDAERLASSYLYYDAQADDARLTLEVIRTAALDHSAVAVNRARVEAITKDATGHANGAVVVIDGESIDVRADAVINAGGVWSDDVRAIDEGTHPNSIRPAKGIHIAVPWDLVRNDIAAVIPVRRDGRSVFVVPWGDFTYIGTTDTDYDGPLDDPQCTPDDIAYLLDGINNVVTSPIAASDIVGTWAGLRPLVASAASENTTDLSRRHQVRRSPSGVVSVTGGKLTTYREMAADTVDVVLEEVLPAQRAGSGRRSILERVKRHSRTKRLRLRGATGFEAARSLRNATIGRLGVEHLVRRHGGETRTILAMIEHDPDLGRPLVDGLPYLRAEALYAVRSEMATSVDDVLSRRTRARLFARDASARAAEDVAALMADDLGWTPAERDAQVAAYRSLIDEERASLDRPDDQTGDPASGLAAENSIAD